MAIEAGTYSKPLYNKLKDGDAMSTQRSKEVKVDSREHL
jgi:hypothetical protein